MDSLRRSPPLPTTVVFALLSLAQPIQREQMHPVDVYVMQATLGASWQPTHTHTMWVSVSQTHASPQRVQPTRRGLQELVAYAKQDTAVSLRPQRVHATSGLIETATGSLRLVLLTRVAWMSVMDVNARQVFM